MLRKKEWLVIVCASALSLLVISSAQSSAGSRTLRFLAVSWPDSRRTLVDHNQNSRPDVGDTFISGSDLYSWAGGKRGAHVGVIRVICTMTAPNAGQCQGTFSLPAGTPRDGRIRPLRHHDTCADHRRNWHLPRCHRHIHVNDHRRHPLTEVRCHDPTTALEPEPRAAVHERKTAVLSWLRRRSHYGDGVRTGRGLSVAGFCFTGAVQRRSPLPRVSIATNVEPRSFNTGFP
jgi:hypothetical protein